MNALSWIARSGARWRDLPDEFGDYKAVKRRCYRWIKRGVLDEVLAALSGRLHHRSSASARSRRKPAKTGAHAQGLGRSGGGLSTKIHAAGDAMKAEQQGDAPEASSESQTPHRAVTVGVAPDSAGPLGSAHQILAEITAIMRDREDQQVYWQFTSPHLGVRRSLSHSGV